MTAVADPTLHTPRLLLRPFVADDAPALFQVYSDPRVMRYWSEPAWTALAQAQRRIAHDTQGNASGSSLTLAVVRRTDAALLGRCTLYAIQPAQRRAEIGYALAASAWGQGLMHEALRALLQHGFATLGLHRVEADIDPRNAASLRAVERLGFVREGLLRERWWVGGEVSDSALYGLLQRDWQARA